MKSHPEASKEILVFDFGRSSTLAVWLEKDGQSVKVKDFARLPVGHESPADAYRSLLKEYLSMINLQNPPKVVAVWDKGMAFRLVTLPDMPADEMKKAILWEMKSKYQVEEDGYLMSWECIHEAEIADGGKEKLFCVFYSEKKAALEKLTLLQEAGLKVSQLVPAQVAMADFAAETDAGEGKDLMLFDIGYQSSRILVVRKGKNMLLRSVPLGGQFLTESMTAEYAGPDGQVIHLSAEQAEKLKTEEGVRDPQAPHVALVRPYLDKIVAEVRRSIDYYESQTYSLPVGKVMFTGGGANLKGLAAFANSFLGIPVAALNADLYASPSFSQEKLEQFRSAFSSFSCAIGAAIAQEGVFDLLPPEIRHEKRQRWIAAGLRFALTAGAILVIFFTGWGLLQIRITSSQIRSIDGEWREINRMNGLIGELQSQMQVQRVALKGDIRLASLLKEISRSTPSALSLEELDYDRGKNLLMIRGLAEGSQQGAVKGIAEFIKALQRSVFFKDVSLVNSTQEGDSKKSRFEIRCATGGVA